MLSREIFAKTTNVDTKIYADKIEPGKSYGGGRGVALRPKVSQRNIWLLKSLANKIAQLTMKLQSKQNG